MPDVAAADGSRDERYALNLHARVSNGYAQARVEGAVLVELADLQLARLM